MYTTGLLRFLNASSGRCVEGQFSQIHRKFELADAQNILSTIDEVRYVSLNVIENEFAAC